MARLQLTEMGSPQTMAAGQTATVDLAPGPIYQKIMIECQADLGSGVVDVPKASWATVFESIRIKANGQSVIEIEDVAALVMMNSYYGIPFIDGALMISLTRPHMRAPWGEDQFGFASLGLQKLQLDIKIKAGANIDSLNVIVEHTGAEVIRPDGSRFIRNWGNSPHLAIRRITEGVSATGSVQVDRIPRSNDFAMVAMHIQTASIGTIRLRANNVEHTMETAKTRELRQLLAGRTPQSGWTHVDHPTDNRIVSLEALNVVDYRAIMDFGATGNFPIYMEFLEGGLRRV